MDDFGLEALESEKQSGFGHLPDSNLREDAVVELVPELDRESTTQMEETLNSLFVDGELQTV